MKVQGADQKTVIRLTGTWLIRNALAIHKRNHTLTHFLIFGSSGLYFFMMRQDHITARRKNGNIQVWSCCFNAFENLISMCIMRSISHIQRSRNLKTWFQHKWNFHVPVYFRHTTMPMRLTHLWTKKQWKHEQWETVSLNWIQPEVLAKN